MPVNCIILKTSVQHSVYMHEWSQNCVVDTFKNNIEGFINKHTKHYF